MSDASGTDGALRPSDALRRPEPGALFPWVKLASYVELALFAALLFFWLMPGFEGETFVFGLSHGIGFIVLCLLVWVAVLRREAPYTLLAATATPAGPVGSVIGIAWIERSRRRRGSHQPGARIIAAGGRRGRGRRAGRASTGTRSG